MMGMPVAWGGWWRASLLHLHLGDQRRGNQSSEELRHWWEMPIPGAVDVNGVSPVLVHLHRGTRLPGHREVLAMAFLSSSC